MLPLFILFGFPLISTAVRFIGYLVKGTEIIFPFINGIVEFICWFVFPFFFFGLFNEGSGKDCCGSIPFLAPDHLLSVGVLIVLNMFAYFYSKALQSFRPVITLVFSLIMISGIGFNLAFYFQMDREREFWFLGNLPIILLLLLRIIKNHKIYLQQTSEIQYSGDIPTAAHRVLLQPAWVRFPLLILLCFPFLLAIGILLLLAGQKPTSLILAFTQTYRHGLSQLECPDVVCPDEHFLCTIASAGHRKLVRPLRYGIRGGRVIEVNRQLLVANAFEELLEQHTPRLHHHIRTVYNRIGRKCRSWHAVLGNSYTSDLVYLLMKPLEWVFVAVLYLADKRPEDRIAVQYLHRSDREKLREVLRGRVEREVVS